MADHRSAFKNLRVSVARGEGAYPSAAPFHPSERYPEYSGALPVSAEENHAYDVVRRSLQLLGLDAARFGTPEWNPLGEFIKPGHTVVIKPNFVLSDHYRGGELFAIITHPAVLRTVVDYAFKALRGDGTIIIADTPQMDCDFQELLERTHLATIAELYQRTFGFPIPLLDLRQFWFKYRDENYLASQEDRHPLPGDPEGNVWVNLAGRSAFDGVRSARFYGADFNREETIVHHSDGRQEYLLSKTILGADVVISVPKLKVHKKVGVTLNAKGFVGTITNKNVLVHYTLGSPEEGGDQFPPGVLKTQARMIVRLQRALYDSLMSRDTRVAHAVVHALYLPYRRWIKPLLKRTHDTITLYDGGNWHGNDSAWRMVSDLMNILMYADKHGVLTSTPQRTIFSVVDGIIGGEGNGPLFPDARPAGVVLAGSNPLAVDLVGTRLMGFDCQRLRWAVDLMHNRHFDCSVHNPGEIQVSSNVPDYERMFETHDRLLAFRPHPGWEGHIEIA